MQNPRRPLITGASSGIGEALAMAYAGPGVSLALTGRDAARLETVAIACRQRGATVHAATVDVTDADAMARWIDALDVTEPIDLVIANAGIGAGTEGGFETAEQTRAVFAVNLGGVLNTVLPLIPRFVARRRGQIALMSSLASFRGFAGAPTYCASKAAVRIWGEGLRGDLHQHGVEVSVICPGFVVSRMTARNKFRMPFLMSADRAAALVKRGLAHNRGRIAFPFPMYFAICLIATLPPLLTDPLFRMLPKKGS
ncbi:MAG: SDR family NAD(P)-dependent oxidoreductase [Gammaproteobacteria bacterium]